MIDLIRPSVRAAWPAFSEPLEGRVPYMYLDKLGLVTCAVGILADPEVMAHRLPWRDRYGKPATSHQVRTAWAAVKARQDLKDIHHREAGRLTDLRLTEEDIDAIVDAKLTANAEHLTKRWFDAFPQWPSDVQLAVLSIAWAVGADWPSKFPICTALLRAGDWRGASAAGKIREAGNPGVVPRNALNRLHLIEAETDLARLYPDVLHGPCTLAALRAGWRTSEPVAPIPLP